MDRSPLRTAAFSMSLTAAAVKRRAAELGFDLCGIATAEAVPQLASFAQWIANGHAGEMHYLVRSADKRADVRHVLPTARSVVVLGTLYNVDRPYSTEIADPRRALISRYAWGDDYHDVIGRRLGALVDWMREAHGLPFDARAYVDTGPVQERAYAQLAGLGWIGKNTCLINPGIGSWLFLSEVICSLALEPDERGFDRCGTCTLCLEACPTGALVGPGVMDARRCLSYFTIELKGPIPQEWHGAIGAHVYGCDICQDVCPWNQAAPHSRDAAWQPRGEFDGVSIDQLASRSDEDLRAAMKGSAMKRTGVKGLRRNLEIALRPRREP
jgi:epoxyqueuosine reductase